MEMLDLAAPHALGMKMLAAIAACSNVLINVAFSLFVAEDAQDVPLAKLAKTAVKAASSALDIAIEMQTKLLNRELLVGVGFQKFDKPATPVGLIGLSHVSPSQSFENHSQIITPNDEFVKGVTIKIADRLICDFLFIPPKGRYNPPR